MNASRSIALALALSALAAPLAGQTIRGRVVDAASGEVVPQARVAVLGPGGRAAARVRVEQDGAFVLALRAAGAYRLQGERAGYQPATSAELDVGEGETVEVELRLSAQPTTLEPLTVTARRGPQRSGFLERSGFYRRAERGGGTFLQRQDLERHADLSVAQALDRAPGTTRIRKTDGRDLIIFDRQIPIGRFRDPRSNAQARGRPADEDGALCKPSLFLDGVAIGQADGVNLVQLGQVEAVELYQGPAWVPPEYGGTRAGCGVIVIWTRREA
jgi:hypothetical protein